MEDFNRFVLIGLPEQRAKETTKNKKLSALLDEVIKIAKAENGCDKTVGTLLYVLASTIHKDALKHLDYLTTTIVDKKLKTAEQIAAAIDYAKRTQTINTEEFNIAAGVGVFVTDQQVKETVERLLQQHNEELLLNRYKMLGPLLSKAKQMPEIMWASSAKIKEQVENQILQILGPKDERDQPQKKKESKANKKTPIVKAEQPVFDYSGTPAMFLEGDLSKLHKPGENPQIKPELMEKHLKETGSKVVTRFPPEPNGYLHIGHAKAININFGYAKANNGICYLRYDDTNPEAEEEIYFDMIKEAVEWLGFTPYAITYSSDYFLQLYELALKLIRDGNAYVCHCTGEEIHKQRGGDEKGPRTACIHRDRPAAESLLEFEKMKQGQCKEGEAILRMKMDLQSGNPQFWDLVAYRILDKPHHRTKDTWKIYPTYDFTHCLCDSFENITHSLCTTEFRQARESYYWLCDALEVYKPVQWESGRLNVTNAVLSKRKIAKLINEGVVDGWDDPRLYTLPALKRRGVPPEAINAFVTEVGVTTAETTIDVARLDFHIRNYLNTIVPRLMALLDPVKVTIKGLDADLCEMLEVPWHPKNPSMSTHSVPFTSVLYIDRSDFREQDEPGYYRLAPGKSVGLLYAKYVIKCTNYRTEDSKVVEIECEVDQETKPQTFIQWISHRNTKNMQVREYEKLFMHSNPYKVEGGWMADINPNSLKIIDCAVVEKGVDESSHDRFQFTRIGYFYREKDVFNRIVALKDSNKN